jgi:uncharacterized protein YodC (DUF2158 family)
VRKLLGFVMTATVALGLGAALPANAGTARSTTAPKSKPAPRLKPGDFVRVRSGGPLMTVTRVQGNQVICSWTDENGVLRSGSFITAILTAPITPPQVDVKAIQSDERAADQYYRSHCPAGIRTITGKFVCDF